MSIVLLTATVVGCGVSHDLTQRVAAQVERVHRVEAGYLARHGSQLEAQGDLRGAVRAYAAALAVDPRFVPLYLRLGDAYERFSRTSARSDDAREEALRRAVVCYRLAADRDPGFRRNALLRLAAIHGPGALAERGSLEGDLQELTELEAPQADWFLALARLQEDGGRLEESEATLLAARQAVPHAAAVHKELARFYRRHERLDASFAVLEHRLERAPDDGEALMASAEACFYRAFRDHRIGAESRLAHARLGIVAARRLLAAEPGHEQGRRYLSLLTRLQGTADATRRAP